LPFDAISAGVSEILLLFEVFGIFGIKFQIKALPSFLPVRVASCRRQRDVVARPEERHSRHHDADKFDQLAEIFCRRAFWKSFFSSWKWLTKWLTNQVEAEHFNSDTIRLNHL
jgi:hypothetical protein